MRRRKVLNVSAYDAIRSIETAIQLLQGVSNLSRGSEFLSPLRRRAYGDASQLEVL